MNPVSQHRNPSDGEYVPHGNPTLTPGLHIPIRNTVGGSHLHLDKTTVRAQEPSIKQDGFESTSQNHASPGMVTVPHNPTIAPGFHIPIGNTIGGAPLHLDKTTVRTHEPSIKRDGYESTSQNHGSPGMVTVPHNPTVAPGFHLPIGNSIGVPMHLDKTTVFRAGEPSIKRDDQ